MADDDSEAGAPAPGQHRARRAPSDDAADMPYAGDECEVVAPSDVLVHGRGGMEDVLEVLGDIAEVHRAETCEGERTRKFDSPNEFEGLLNRVDKRWATVVLRKLFLYRGNPREPAKCSVMQEIWIQDKRHPDVVAARNPSKSYAVAHVHHHSSRRVDRVEDITPEHLAVVDAVNFRHICDRGSKYQGDNPFFDTYIEPSGGDTLKVFPDGNWRCSKCGQDNWQSKPSCRGRRGAACAGVRPCREWQWTVDSQLNAGLAQILGAADETLQWASGSGTSKFRAAGGGSSQVHAERLDSLRSAYLTRGPRKPASGLKWKSVGVTEPTTGRALDNPALASALASRTELTQAEWDAFGIDDLCMDHHIKSGAQYLKPATPTAHIQGAGPPSCHVCKRSPCSDDCPSWHNLHAAVLCIGLGEYKCISRLPNAVGDARELCKQANDVPDCRAEVLEGIKDAPNLVRGVRRFLQRNGLQQHPPKAVLVVCCGHGMQSQGKVYLIPEDASHPDDRLGAGPDKEYVALSEIFNHCRDDLDDHARRLKPAREPFFLLIFDACRVRQIDFQNPVSSRCNNDPNSSAPAEFALCFSCSRDSEARDGRPGEHSPFAQGLLDQTTGIFVQGMPLKNALEGACRRLGDCAGTSGQKPVSVCFDEINAGLCLFPATGVEVAASENTDEKPGDDFPVVSFLREHGLARVAEYISTTVGLEDVRHLQILMRKHPEEIDKLDKLTPVQKTILHEICLQVTADYMSPQYGTESASSPISSPSETLSQASTPVIRSPRAVVGAYHVGDSQDLRQHAASLFEHFNKYYRIVEHNVQDQSYHLSDFDVDIEEEFSGHWTFCMLIWSAFMGSAHVSQDVADRWLQQCQRFPQQRDLLPVIDELTTRCMIQDHPQLDEIKAKVARYVRRPIEDRVAAVAVVDIVVQAHLIGDDVAASRWQTDVVKGWYDSREGPKEFLLRANRFLRESIDGIKILQTAFETGSYVMYMTMSSLAALLLFEHLELTKRGCIQIVTRKSGRTCFHTAIHGFRLFVSSSGRVLMKDDACMPEPSVLPLIVQGLRCAAHLQNEEWEMLGPFIRLAKLREDRGLVLAAVQRDGRALEFASKGLRGDREVVMAAVQQDGRALELASEELRGDREVVLAAVQRDGRALEFASKGLRGDREVVLAAVQRDGRAPQFASEELWGDREMVLDALERDGRALDGWALEFASEELRGDREVVLAAVQQDGRPIASLKIASEELRGDREVVLAAVQRDGGALEFASEELRGDREVVLAAVQRSWSAIASAKIEMKGDREVVMAAVQQDATALLYAGREARGNQQVVLAAVKLSGCALKFASEELRGVSEVVLAAVQQNWRALEFASKELRGDREVVLAAVQRDGRALEFASEELRGDREVALAAVQQDRRAIASAKIEMKGDREVEMKGNREKRWGDGIEAPAAGTRHFVPPGFEVTRDVAQSIAMFGHSPAHVADIVEAGRRKAAMSPFPLAEAHAAALYAYTEETPMYKTLNYTMRTPHTQKTPTDTQLKFFADYIVHAERALSSLPTHVSEQYGVVYRGIKVLLSKDLYSPGKQFTWQAFSSATSKQVATLDFVQMLPGRKLMGSLFVIHSITGKDIRHFSAFPSEGEVLFPPNSQFKVDRVVTSAPDKAALLTDLSAYDLTDLDVYVIMQVA